MKRSRIELLRDMLVAVHDKGGVIKPTHLLYKANLSHDAMKAYVKELQEQGLLRERLEDGKTLYVLTDKGYKFLEEYKRFTSFAEAFGI